MTSFLFRKMRKNKWLMLCLFIGNILLIGIAAATPMYSMATVTRMLHQAMRLRQTNQNIYPASSQLSYHFEYTNPDFWLSAYETTHERILGEMLETLGVPVEQTVRTYRMGSWQVDPVTVRDVRPFPRSINLFATQYLEENILLTHGRMPAAQTVLTEIEYYDEDGVFRRKQAEVFEAIAMDASLFRLNLLYDELLQVRNVYDRHEGDELVYMRVVGIFDIPDENLPFWAIVNFEPMNSLVFCENLVRDRLIENYHPTYSITATWHTVHDFSEMHGANLTRYIDGILENRERFAGTNRRFTQNYYELLREHEARAAEFNLTIIVLQLPLYALLAFYMYVVSRKILQQEQNDISVLKSRGASRLQIFGLYVWQGLIIGVLAFPIGILFGVGVCRVLGASAGFLEIMGRTELVIQVSPTALLFGVGAALFSFLAMILPVIRFSRVGIIEHKLNKSGKPRKSLWQRYFLDVICLGVALYGLYNFNLQQEFVRGDFVDPTLFVLSTLFMVGAGLFCLRVFPYIIKLVFWMSRRFMPISMYTAIIRVARSVGEEQFIMIFLVFTMSIGIFSAQAARTINLNAEHEILYLGGADLVFAETWAHNGGMIAMGFADELIFTEPSFERFTQFEETNAVTRVMNRPATMQGMGSRAPRMIQDTQLLAIETQSFGETVWFRDDFLPVHMNYFLNVLAQVPHGVLVSENLREQGFVIGDSIWVSHTWEIPDPTGGVIEIHDEIIVTIVGFVERWPGFEPISRQELADSNVIHVPNNLVVGNLGHFRAELGAWPYEIWFSTNSETNRFFYDFLREESLRYERLDDVKNTVVQGRLDPLLQGTNGVLTVNFIVTLLVCFSGFLIYWILSIRERVLQFGIFRAMGMRMRSIIALLVNEQIFITITALVIGAGIGELSARLYVPLIQLAYSNQVIPLIVVMEARDYVNLYAVMAAMILVCLAVLIWFISRIRIDQALKLGED
ncbi:MAG: FtsX-like permease family protein [Defluviitaleaceae bacterium]|nr:FtsX-like permease family protein [Defluviitaleaceae bacterium]